MEVSIEEIAQNYNLPLSKEALKSIKNLFQSYQEIGEPTYFIEMTRRANIFAEPHPSFNLPLEEALHLLLNKAVEIQSTFSLNLNYPITYPQLPKEYDPFNPINSQILEYTVFYVCYSNQKLRSHFFQYLPPPALCSAYPPEVSQEIEDLIPSGEKILSLLDNLKPGILIKNYMIHLIRNCLLFLYARFKESDDIDRYIQILEKPKWIKFLPPNLDSLEKLIWLSLLKILESIANKSVIEYSDLITKLPSQIKEWLSF